MSPFVLLDDARPRDAGPARLYRDPSGMISARAPAEVRSALEALRQALREGRHAAGFLSYDAGHALEPRLAPLARTAGENEPPLLWFGLFDRAELVAQEDVPALLGDPAGAFVGSPAPLLARTDHEAAVARAQELIGAGDIYQANLTFAAEVPLAGDPRAIYERLRAAQQAGWGGIAFTGAHWLLSASPELFFTITDGRIVARPMKGTQARLPDRAEDAAARDALGSDVKNRAENLMIVDLIRNDLARVAEPGSVAVPRLFDVESYRTIHHMTSTIMATLAEGRDAIDAIEALFPCGSVTGAPKIRAMEIIADLERRPRGPYTGSIGWLDPNGDAGFNVAIRTLVFGEGERVGTLGLGSAIVADSDAAAEWRECLAKGAFVSAARPSFDLIETMRFDAEEGFADVERHLARLKASAEALGFAFDRHDARNELQAATFRLRRPARIRLRLARGGKTAIEVRPLPQPPSEPVRVAIVPLPVAASDYRLAHKTSDRGFYDEARTRSGAFETIFADADGFLTEGSFTSLFVERDGMLLTPPLARGLLPGVLRARLVEEGRAEEADLRANDLANGFLIGNAVRGLIRARLK